MRTFADSRERLCERSPVPDSRERLRERSPVARFVRTFARMRAHLREAFTRGAHIYARGGCRDEPDRAGLSPVSDDLRSGRRVCRVSGILHRSHGCALCRMRACECVSGSMLHTHPAYRSLNATRARLWISMFAVSSNLRGMLR